MKESILHYVWQYKLFPVSALRTVDGKDVEIIDIGKPNTDAGPDFFNAKLKINGTLWAGNVEIHPLSSDWIKHHHQKDKAYDNVILHVVGKADAEVTRTNGEYIPQMELPVSEIIGSNYKSLFAAKKWIPCEDKIAYVPEILINTWKTALLTERLEQKVSAIDALLKQNNNHWEEAFYVSLARSFGFGTNSQAFETLARSLSLSVLAKHKDNLFQIEALLFGQSGLLDNAKNDDEYLFILRKEYQFLKAKYQLASMDVSQWRLLRLRPDNFPHIRIAQFAGLIHSSSKLFSKILHTDEIKQLRKLFNCEVADYWQNHYLFGEKSRFSQKHIGDKSIDILLINTVIPFVFTYLKKKNEDTEFAVRLLESIPAENNAVIKKWKELKLEIRTAFDTQALLQLKKKYCDDKKCLRCRIGHKVLTIDYQSIVNGQ